MKNLSSMLLIAAFLTMTQSIDCGQESQKIQQEIVNKVMQESYITPALQLAVLSYLQDPGVVILDTTTGMLQGIQPVQKMLQAINEKIAKPTQPITITEKTYMQHALQAMLEATDIALMNISIKTTYKDSLIAPIHKQITSIVQGQKQAVQTLLKKVTAHHSIQGDIPTPTDSPTSGNQISTATIRDIIKHNDYTTMSNPLQAANLLFAQCFIALQQYKADRIPVNLSGHISATNYAYTNFPAIYNASAQSYPICHQIITVGGPHVHQSLLEIRQAIQMSIYIANKKSASNIGNMLPASITSYVDPIINQLLRYDAHLNALCINPLYGATPADIAQAQAWSTMTKVAVGVATAAVAVGAVHAYDPHAFSYLAEQTNDLINWLGGHPTKAEQAKVAEQVKVAEQQKTELARLKAEEFAAEQTRLAEEQRLAEELRLTELARIEAEQLAAEQAHLAEQQRLAEELRQAEIARIKAEEFATEQARLVEEQRLTEELRQAEIARLAEEKAQLEAKNKADFYNTIGIGIGIAGGAALGSTAGSRTTLNEKVEQEFQQYRDSLRKNTKPTTIKNTEQFQYFNYLDSPEERTTKIAQEGIKKDTQIRKINALKQRQEMKQSLTARGTPSVPEIEVKKVKLVCDVMGYPTETAIKDLMKREFFSETASTKLTVTVIPGGGANGAMSDKLYCVSIDNKPIFFLKINKPDLQVEIQKSLMQIQQGRIGRIATKKRYAEIVAAYPERKLPILTWIEKFFIYTNPSGSQVIIEMSHAAKGKQVNYILEHEDLESQKKCMLAVGKALGTFQQIFMNYNNSNNPADWLTVSHADFHDDNIFYDESKDQVYFIDNERMIGNSSTTIDWKKMQKILNCYFPQNAKLLISSFFTGYLAAFPQKQSDLLVTNYFTLTPAANNP